MLTTSFLFSGALTIQLRAGNVAWPREMFVVPKGVEHCPIAEEEHLLLIERAGTPNTGDATAARHELSFAVRVRSRQTGMQNTI
jgi:mannose-6-phosphate isomerase-like protein (cupin superfamily)